MDYEIKQAGKNTYYCNDGVVSAKLTVKRLYGGIDIKCNCRQGYTCKHRYYLQKELTAGIASLNNK